VAGRFPLSVLTAEGRLYGADVEFVVVPAADGEIGILDRHQPLLALLKAGPLRISANGLDRDYEDVLFVSGGFVDVGRDHQDKTVVTVLADSGERARDIDEARAEEARRRAQDLLSQRLSAQDYAEAAALLERSTARVRVAELGRRRGPKRERPTTTE
jgi:F-type H+-transporting ATPase subunit epsilon